MKLNPPYKVGEKLYMPALENISDKQRSYYSYGYNVVNGRNVRPKSENNQFYYLGSRESWLIVLPSECLKPDQVLPDKPPSLKDIRKYYPEALQVHPINLKAERFRGGYKTFL